VIKGVKKKKIGDNRREQIKLGMMKENGQKGKEDVTRDETRSNEKRRDTIK